MIFYFSGTGNSYYAAKNIGQKQNERVISISDEMNLTDNAFIYELKEDEVLGFVFPVYAWAPPNMVLDFIKKMKIKGFEDNYTFAICTCGADAGKTIDILKKQLMLIDIPLCSAFSLQMPDNCVLIMDVEDKSEQDKKLEHTDRLLVTINDIIKNKKRQVFKVKKGNFPDIKSHMGNALFNKFMVRTNKFYSTDECISCGLCEDICTAKIITVDEKPFWEMYGCTMCLACINRCPKHAIQCGKKTIKRGRYVNPNV